MQQDGDGTNNHTADTNASSIGAPSVKGGLNPEASRLFRVYRTVANMLSNRGYMVSKELREMTPALFTTKFGEFPQRESLTILVVRNNIEYLFGWLVVCVTLFHFLVKQYPSFP